MPNHVLGSYAGRRQGALRLRQATAKDMWFPSTPDGGTVAQIAGVKPKHSALEKMGQSSQLCVQCDVTAWKCIDYTSLQDLENCPEL